MPRIFHAVDVSGPRCARVEKASVACASAYTEGIVPIRLACFPRLASETIGDGRPLPYLKDLLCKTLESCEQEDDIVLWTNSDIVLGCGISDLLRSHLSFHHAASMRRTESNGRGHPGRDLFAFTAKWVRSKWEEMPDYILGAPVFDLGLVAMIRKHHGHPCGLSHLARDIHPSELPPGYALHESHQPSWTPTNNNKTPSVLHNRTLFQQWSLSHAPELKFNKDGNLQ